MFNNINILEGNNIGIFNLCKSGYYVVSCGQLHINVNYVFCNNDIHVHMCEDSIIECDYNLRIYNKKLF